MKRIILAPDSFKGGISALEFCNIVKPELEKIFKTSEIISVPIADGGEGSLESLCIAAKGTLHDLSVTGPLGEKVSAKLLFTDSNHAVIEMAQCAGLPLVKGRENPEETTTYGVGELISYAVREGAKNITVSLGGSATNDCGTGMLAALGVRFADGSGNTFVPTGKTLGKIKTISFPDEFEKYKNVRFTAMCDIKNPLLGKFGCAHIFARQKGADDSMISRLESAAASFSKVSAEFLGRDFSSEEGAGAAGGMGFACRAFLNADLKRGIDAVLELCRFDDLAKSADLIITGEGRFDAQSLMGKVIGGISEHRFNADIAVICGKYNPFELPENSGIKYIIPIHEGLELDYAIAHTREYLIAGVSKLINMLGNTRS